MDEGRGKEKGEETKVEKGRQEGQREWPVLEIIRTQGRKSAIANEMSCGRAWMRLKV